MSLLTATPASLREALRAGADRCAGYRSYKYFAPTEHVSGELLFTGSASRKADRRDAKLHLALYRSLVRNWPRGLARTLDHSFPRL
jgi:hypothetical protein